MALRPVQSSPTGQHLVGAKRHVPNVDGDADADGFEKKSGNLRGRISRFFSPSRPQQIAKRDENGSISMGIQTDGAEVKDVSVNTLVEWKDFAHTPSEDEIKQMMLCDEPTPNYWKMLAEQRQSTVDELYKANAELTREVAFLREENRSLREVVRELDTMQALLEQVLHDGDGIEVHDHYF